MLAMSAGIPELVRSLHQRGTSVFLVSGGFHAIIDPIAVHLSIPADHVFANSILFKVCYGLAFAKQHAARKLLSHWEGSFCLKHAIMTELR